MPRSFDSDENPGVLVFTENVDCPRCGEFFPGLFVDLTRSLSVQDMTDAPVGEHRCPACAHEWSSELTGWMFYNEAG